MRRATLGALVLAVIALGLIACGGGDDPVTVKGTGYTYRAPAGWDDLTGNASEIADALSENGADVTAEDIGASYDSIIVADSDTDGFKTNFNVTLKQGVPSALTARRLATESASILADPDQAASFLPDGFTIDYSGEPQEKTTLGGEEAYEISYDASVSGKDLKATQIYVVRDGTAYVATFTASAKAFDEDKPDFERIVKSWRFK